MRTYLKIIFLLLIGFSAKSQSPVGLPSPNAPFSYYHIGWLQTDSGYIYAPRDTTIRSKYPGLTLFWGHAGVDSSIWLFNGRKYVKELNSQDTLPGRFLVTPSFLNNQGFIKNVTGYIQAGSNVTLAGLGTFVSPYVINSTASGTGTVTNFSFTNGNGIIGTITNPGTTPNLSISTSLNGIVNANGTGFGTVTIGSGLNYAGGVLTATGGTSLNGLIYGNGSIFAVANLGAGLSFSAGTLTNTINNTNQLTNGAAFITNITSLITAGTNISITGSGTSGSPYIINSTGGGGGGTVTTFSAGNLSPLFTTSVTNPSTIPGLSFSLSTATANSVFGNNTGSLAIPVYYVPNATTVNGWLGYTAYNSTNPSSYISNITGLVTAGTNIIITGSGTSGSPYVVNSIGGGTPDTIHLSAYGTGKPILSTNIAGNILFHRTFENTTTLSWGLNADSSIFGTVLLTPTGSLTNPSGANWSLVNDNASPGNNFLYATSSIGTKGWLNFFSLPLASSSQNGLLSSSDYNLLHFTQFVVNLGTPGDDSVLSASIAGDSLYGIRKKFVAGSGIGISKTGSVFGEDVYTFSATGGGSFPSMTAYTYPGNATNTTTSTPQLLNYSVFNVRDFITGFVDSVTDCTVGIQAAINAVGPKGGAVYIPAGNYITSGTLVIPVNKPIHLYGDAGPALTYRNNFTTITSVNGSRIINTSLSDTGLRNYSNGTIIENLTIKNSNPIATASTNVGLYMDSSSNCIIRNIQVENFNTDIFFTSGAQYKMYDCEAINPHTYAYRIKSYAGLDAGDGRMINCFSYATVPTWSATDTCVEVESGGGLQMIGGKYGGSVIGVNFNWLGFTDIIMDNVSIEATVQAVRVHVQPGASLTNFQITGGNYIFTGNKGIEIDATASGSSIASGIIDNISMSGTVLSADTGIYIHGSVTNFIVGSKIMTTNVATPVVSNGLFGTPVPSIEVAPAAQTVTEAANMLVDLHKGSAVAYSQTNLVDTMTIVNSGVGNFFTIQVGSGITGAKLVIAGGAAANYAQVDVTAVWLNPTVGKVTEITCYSYTATSFIVTNISTSGWLNGAIPFYGGNVLRQDTANYSYTSASTTLKVNNLSVIQNPRFNTTSTSGNVWTATDAIGNGHWAASAGGGAIAGPNLGMAYPFGGNSYASPSVLLDSAHNGGLDIVSFNTTNVQQNGRGLLLQSGTAALSGSQVQLSGSIVQLSNLWNTTATASQTYAWIQQITGTGGATINANWNLGYSNNGGTTSQMLTVVPGVGLGVNNTNPGTIFDGIQTGSSYGMILHNSTGFINIGALNTTTGALVFGAAMSGAGAMYYDISGNFRTPGHLVSGTQTDPNVAQIFGISTTQPQEQLRYDATHFTNFTTDAAGKMTIAPSGITTIHVASVAGAASINIPVGAAVTSPNQGDIWAVSGQLNYRDGSTTYNLLAGTAPTLQNVVTNGSTMTSSTTVALATFNWTFSNGHVGVNTTAISTSNLVIGGAGTGSSSLNIISGTAPTSPNDGDIWQQSSNHHLYVSLNGTSYQLDQQGSVNIYTTDGTLAGNRTLTQSGNSLTFSGGQFIIGATGGTRTWNPNSGTGAILSILPGTLNDATTSSSGTVANAFVISSTGATLTASNTSVTVTNAYGFFFSAPAAGTNVTIGHAYALGTNGDVAFRANAYISHVLELTTPTIVAGAGAGTSPTISISGGDQSGIITVTTGTLPTLSATVATITYSTTFPTGTYPILAAGNSNAALLSGATMVYTTGSTSNFIITSGTTALTPATTYIWYFKVGGN